MPEQAPSNGSQDPLRGKSASWGDMIRAGVSVLGIRGEAAPEGVNPRQRARESISKTIDGLSNTLGHEVLYSIGSIQLVAGEDSARTVHEVFERTDLIDALRTPSNSANAPLRRHDIAKAEYDYWKRSMLRGRRRVQASLLPSALKPALH